MSVCSGNPSKVGELHELFPDWELELLDAGPYPPEDGVTYLDNARIKARFGRAHGPADRWMVADDSGIELAALGGAPGVHTQPWSEGRHVEKALAAVDGADRSARYVCELVLLAPDGTEHRGTGVLDGRIAEAPAGDEGFGFDPVFVPLGETRTVAQLGDAWKAERSHRALAARALRERLSSAPPG